MWRDGSCPEHYWGGRERERERERSSSLNEINAHSGDLCFSAARQDNEWMREAFCWGAAVNISLMRQFLFSILQYSRYSRIQSCSMYCAVLFHIRLTVVNIPEGERCQEKLLSECKETWITKIWRSAFSHLDAHLCISITSSFPRSTIVLSISPLICISEYVLTRELIEECV